jgi:hypothetical protein
MEDGNIGRGQASEQLSKYFIVCYYQHSITIPRFQSHVPSQYLETDEMFHHKEPPFPLRLSSTGYVPQTQPPTPGILSIIHNKEKEISGVRGHEHTAAFITPVGKPD